MFFSRMEISDLLMSRLWRATALVTALAATLTLVACQGDFANRADAPIPVMSRSSASVMR